MPPSKNNKKNNSKNNGFYWYMQSVAPDLRRNGRQFDMHQLVAYARPLWKRMNAHDKEPFDKRAKEERIKNRGLRPDTERLDNLGNIIAHRIEPEELLRIKRSKDRKQAQTMWPEDPEELVKQRFYLISFEYLCEMEDPAARGRYNYVPREVGLIEWSMEKGITKELHRFINTDGIPMGLRYAASQMNEVHHIPVETFELDDDDYYGLWCEIANFINPGSELADYPPVYCMSHQLKMCISCIEWIYNKCQFQNYPNFLADKFYVLDDAVQDMFAHIGQSVSPTSIFHMLTTTNFDLEPGTRCDWHEKDGGAVCALGTTKRCVYAMADAMCQPFGFVLTSAHMPDANAKRPSYNVSGGGASFGAQPPPPPPPPPSQNKQTRHDAFPSRDFRYASRAPSEFESEDEDDYADDSEADDYDEDDFPTLGSTPKPTPSVPFQPEGPWVPRQMKRSPSPPRMTLQEAARLKEEQDRILFAQAEREQGGARPKGPMSASIRPAFANTSASSSARPKFIPPSAGPVRSAAPTTRPSAPTSRPAYIPPRASAVPTVNPWQGNASQPAARPAAVPSAAGPMFIPPSSFPQRPAGRGGPGPAGRGGPAGPSGPAGRGGSAGRGPPVFIPPSGAGDAPPQPQPVSQGAAAQPNRPNMMGSAGVGRGGRKQPSNQAPPPQAAADQQPAFPPMPTTRPLGIGRGRATLPPPPGFGRGAGAGN